MTASTYAALAAICALLAYGITLDAMLNTQYVWYKVGSVVFSICCVVCLTIAVWKVFA